MSFKSFAGRACVLGAMAALSACAGGANVEQGTYGPKPQALDLAKAEFKGGHPLNLTVGIGSGAFHYKGDPDNVFYTVTDRGPNIKCNDTQKTVGVADLALCGGDKNGKVFPTPNFVPTIFKIALNADHSFDILETVTLKNTIGQPISGLSNPLVTTDTEKAFAPDGTEMAMDPNGLDVEGVVRLSDGTFWIGEEYGPSIAHIAADGRVIERLVPFGLEGDLKAAGYPVKGKLPGILKWRKLNRGIESMAVSPDEKSLYFAMQSPLAHPDSKTYKASDAVRLFKMDIATGEVVGEYIYPLDDPASFAADNAKKKRKQNDVKVSELTALGQDKLLVLERISKTTKFYVVDLASATNIAGTKWDADIVSPTLEQLGVKGMADKGAKALAKSLALNTDDRTGMPAKIEGIGLIDATTMMLVNDNDFGIAGDNTTVVITHLDQPLF